MVESSNGADSVIFYGKGGDIATNRGEELEMSVLCHVQPYGEVRLDVAKRLSLGGAAQAPEAGNPD
ncbi:hypothetical protein [Nonomuraea fuscirosea]|uniref:hypothetical protein n=1 Tax=Nonomuraea fuscirosea TaxID=1291556 RepID=UPI0033D72DDE